MKHGGRIQIIRSPAGEEMVVLPRAEYEALVAAAEASETAEDDGDDVAIHDARKAELAAGQAGLLPPEVSKFLIQGNSRLKAVRMWRGLTQVELARRAGLGQGYLSDIENGRRPGTAEVLRSLAGHLDVPAKWVR